ncbi:MAG: hypothetical protein AMS22_16095 [Thiotrichales bacterium SG8_50]|nr:MAG: hypothetical protein AMS22_16095 [Thiotrichales bacterium SG8_50]
MTLLAFLEWTGALTGLAGAALLATRTRASGWGFVLFLGSNLAWGTFGWLSDAMGLVVMQIGFTATSLYGIHNWVWKNPGRFTGRTTVPEVT